MTRSWKRHLNAFSLIELLLVVLLISVLAGISFPRFNQVYANIRLQQAVDDLSGLMRYAQGRAIARQETLQINFNTEKTAYRLMTGLVGQASPIEGRRGRIYRVPDGILLEAEHSQILFYPSGQMQRVEIFLSNTPERKFIVTTKEIRGSVHVFESHI